MRLDLILIKKIKPLLFIVLLTPSFYLYVKFFMGKMGVNPIDSLMRELGEFSLQLIILTLLISPLIQIKLLRNLQSLRRMIGLFAFYYMCLHLSTYIIIDHYFNWDFILKDVYKRPFITLGFLAYILTIPLAITSNNTIVRKLTYRLWKKIHKIVYIVGLLGSLHYYLLTKADKTEPLIYLVIIVILLIFRLFSLVQKRLINQSLS